MTSRRIALKCLALASSALCPFGVLADEFDLDDTAAPAAARPAPVRVNEAGAAFGYQAGTAARFGRYGGVAQDGAIATGWFYLQDRETAAGTSPFYVLFEGENLDWGNQTLLPDASVKLRVGEQGVWDARLAYDGFSFLETDNFHTLFDSSGALPSGLAPDSISTTASNAAGVAKVKQYLSVVDVGIRRDKVDGSITYDGVRDWSFATALEHEHKHGTKANSFMFISNNNFAAFLEPVNYDTDRFTASAAYTRPQMQALFSYSFSSFTDHKLQWVAMNPFDGTPRAGYTGSQYTLPPSNSEHAVKAQVGMAVGETGRLTSNLRYGLQVQDDTLGGRYYDAGSSLVTDSSYRGEIHNLYGNVAFTTRPTRDWDMRLAYTIDNRDNRSASYFISPSYRSDSGTATWNGSSGVRYNLPYSFKNQTAELETGYRLTRGLKLVGSYAYQDRQRDYSVTNRNQENIFGGKILSSLGQGVSASLGYSRSIRQAQDYDGNLGWKWMGRTISAETELGQYNYAARNRDEIKANVNWSLSDQLSLGTGASWANNVYPSSTWGVIEDHQISINPDLAWSPAPGFSAHLYYSYQELFTNNRINASTAATGVAWTMKNQDQIHTLGAGAEWQAAERLKITFDNAFSMGTTAFHIASWQRNTANPTPANTGSNLPDAVTLLNSLRLSGEYDLGDGLSVGLTGLWERLLSQDYLNWQQAAAIGNVSTTTVTTDGSGNPGYSAGVLMATARLKW